MNNSIENLVAANIVVLGAGLVVLALRMFWGRAVLGAWPGPTKVLVFVIYIVTVIVVCNIVYIYSVFR